MAANHKTRPNLENVRRGIWRSRISPTDSPDESGGGEVSRPSIYQQVGCEEMGATPASISSRAVRCGLPVPDSDSPRGGGTSARTRENRGEITGGRERETGGCRRQTRDVIWSSRTDRVSCESRTASEAIKSTRLSLWAFLIPIKRESRNNKVFLS